MSGWIIFWGILIVFSVLSFTYMSIKILIKGLVELKEMFVDLSKEGIIDADLKNLE